MVPAVLFVDDEKAICSALRRSFKNTSIQFFTANSGKDALSLLRDQKIDLVVSDQRMPGMNGTELLTQVKNLYPNVGRIILSGHSDMNDMIGAINEADIDQFISKPWVDSQLVKIVNDNLSSSLTANHIANKQSLAVNHLRTSRASEFNSVHFELEKSIKNHELNIDTKTYLPNDNYSPILEYLQISWPEKPSLHHDELTKLARHSSYLRSLFAWYLCSVADYLKSHTDGTSKLVVDVYTDSFINNPTQRDLFAFIIENYEDVVYRIPSTIFRQNKLDRLLSDICQHKREIILNLEDQSFDLQALAKTPVKYLEMAGLQGPMTDPLLFDQKITFSSAARKVGIRTILTGAQNRPCPLTRFFDYI